MRVGVIAPFVARGDDEFPTWQAVRAYARHAEEVGFDSIWGFDHLYSGRDGVPPGDIHEAWTMLSAIAAVTSRVELGQLVTCTSFRSPGLLGKMSVTVDEISGGRLTLGLGAGWYDDEYRAFGFPIDHRGTRFDEYMAVLAPLLRGEEVTFTGRYHRAEGARLLPPPSRRLPLLIAGKGPRLLEMVARNADAWNTAWYSEPNDTLHTRLSDLRRALEAAGREPSSMRVTVGVYPEGLDDADSLARALESFKGLGIDDLIVSQDRKDPTALDLLWRAVELAQIG
jgi:probable F420-dependent oxidoreductase